MTISHNTAQKDRYINARNKYKPDSVKFLIVAESPPSSGGYFYFDFAVRHDYLFKETMRALDIIPETVDIDEGFNKAPLLKQFQSRGFFVIDIVYTAISELSDSEMKQAISDGLPGFEDEVKDLNPDWIIIVKESIYEKAKNRLVALGLKKRILNRGPIHFPPHGQPVGFRKTLRELIVPIESRDCDETGGLDIKGLESSRGANDDDRLEPMTDARGDEVEDHIHGSLSSEGDRTETEVSQVEIALRRLIAECLEGKYGSNWYKQGVPHKVKEDIERTMNKDTSKYPYKTVELKNDPSRLLEYTYITHLAEIITWTPNWEVFAGVFRNVDETNRRALQLQTYRNHVMHSRRLDEVVATDGRAAKLWFLKCIDCR